MNEEKVKMFLGFLFSLLLLQACAQIQVSSKEYHRLGPLRGQNILNLQLDTSPIPIDFVNHLESQSDSQRIKELHRSLTVHMQNVFSSLEKKTSLLELKYLKVPAKLRVSRCVFESGFSPAHLIYRSTCFAYASYKGVFLIESSGHARIETRLKARVKAEKKSDVGKQPPNKIDLEVVQESLQQALKAAVRQIYNWREQCDKDKSGKSRKLKKNTCFDTQRRFLLKFWKANQLKFKYQKLKKNQQIEMLSEFISFAKVEDLKYIAGWEKHVDERTLEILFQVYRQIPPKICGFYKSKVLEERIIESSNPLYFEKLREKELKRCQLLLDLF